MAFLSTSRNARSYFADAVTIFILNDNHVRDHSLYTTHSSVYTGQPIGFTYNAAGTGTHNYNVATGQFSVANPPNTGAYDFVEYTDLLIPDCNPWTSIKSGESDVFAKIRIVEVMQGANIAANIANHYLHLKTSVFKQIIATDHAEVNTGVFLYEDNGNVPSYSETDYIDSVPHYLTPNDVNVVTDPDEVRVNGLKNFIVQPITLPTVLNKSFSFELQMNSEGVLHEAQLLTSERKEIGNAS